LGFLFLIFLVLFYFGFIMLVFYIYNFIFILLFYNARRQSIPESFFFRTFWLFYPSPLNPFGRNLCLNESHSIPIFPLSLSFRHSETLLQQIYLPRVPNPFQSRLRSMWRKRRRTGMRPFNLQTLSHPIYSSNCFQTLIKGQFSRGSKNSPTPLYAYRL